MAFKPDIEDLRESPAVHVAESLGNSGYNIVAVEPNIEEHQAFELSSPQEALEQADIIAVLVKHREFLEMAREGALSKKVLLDFCGIGA